MSPPRVRRSFEVYHLRAGWKTWLRANFTKPLHVEQLANTERMGVSTRHHQFRALSGYLGKTVPALAFVALPTWAASVTLTVPGIADVWLAGQPNGATDSPLSTMRTSADPILLPNINPPGYARLYH